MFKIVMFLFVAFLLLACSQGIERPYRIALSGGQVVESRCPPRLERPIIMGLTQEGDWILSIGNPYNSSAIITVSGPQQNPSWYEAECLEFVEN